MSQWLTKGIDVRQLFRVTPSPFSSAFRNTTKNRVLDDVQKSPRRRSKPRPLLLLLRSLDHSLLLVAVREKVARGKGEETGILPPFLSLSLSLSSSPRAVSRYLRVDRGGRKTLIFIPSKCVISPARSSRLQPFHLPPPSIPFFLSSLLRPRASSSRASMYTHRDVLHTSRAHAYSGAELTRWRRYPPSAENRPSFSSAHRTVPTDRPTDTLRDGSTFILSAALVYARGEKRGGMDVTRDAREQSSSSTRSATPSSLAGPTRPLIAREREVRLPQKALRKSGKRGEERDKQSHCSMDRIYCGFCRARDTA